MKKTRSLLIILPSSFDIKSAIGVRCLSSGFKNQWSILLEYSMEYFWSTFGVLLEYFLGNYGVLLEYFWSILRLHGMVL